MEEQISSISRVLARIRDAAQEALRERHPAHDPADGAPARAEPAPLVSRGALSHAVWLTVEEAARYLGLPSRKALYQAVRRGHVPAHRLGRVLRFRRLELDAALARR
jgi:excisionase family DNA binding protein